MSISAIVTRGFGPPGSAALVVTMGFGVGEAPAVNETIVTAPRRGFMLDTARRTMTMDNERRVFALGPKRQTFYL